MSFSRGWPLVVALSALGCSSSDTPLDADVEVDAGDEVDAAMSTTSDGGGEEIDTGAPAIDAFVLADTGGSTTGCAAGSRPGAVGVSDGHVTGAGRHFNVRTPDGYDPTVASPLIVMFAPSGHTGLSIESSSMLTPDATAAGFVVAYVDTVSPANIPGAMDAATIPDLIAAEWCVDRERVYLTGSSDGGGLIYTIVLNHYMTPEPAAIAPFAAGASRNTLMRATCLEPPMPVMVMHNSGDTVFPMYGRAARDWWIDCNACGAPQTLADGCLAYQGCADGAEVRYCEGTGGHGRWPGLHSSMFEFFGRFTRAAR